MSASQQIASTAAVTGMLPSSVETYLAFISGQRVLSATWTLDPNDDKR